MTVMDRDPGDEQPENILERGAEIANRIIAMNEVSDSLTLAQAYKHQEALIEAMERGIELNGE